MTRLNNADIIKALLIDFIIDNEIIGDCLFGSELFYGSKKRQTDLLAVNGYTTAFEIKSQSDDFRKVREQLDDYKKVFEFQYLVTTESQEKKARSYLKTNEGLIIINSDSSIIIKRKATKIKGLSKKEILETIPFVFLKKHFNVPNKYTSSSLARTYLMRQKIDSLQFALKSFLKEKLMYRNEIFLEEKGDTTHFEEIRLLSSNISLSL